MARSLLASLAGLVTQCFDWQDRQLAHASLASDEQRPFKKALSKPVRSREKPLTLLFALPLSRLPLIKLPSLQRPPDWKFTLSQIFGCCWFVFFCYIRNQAVPLFSSQNDTYFSRACCTNWAKLIIDQTEIHPWGRGGRNIGWSSGYVTEKLCSPLQRRREEEKQTEKIWPNSKRWVSGALSSKPVIVCLSAAWQRFFGFFWRHQLDEWG